jgi:uncharacterized protein YecE (DUF72 family)
MIRVGTCSWTEKSLIRSGEFYPKTVNAAESRLKFYAERFNVVEVDSTYYALPTKTNSFLWADRTPEDFVFHIKAYGVLTGHAVDPRMLPPDIFSELPENDKRQKRVFVNERRLVKIITDKFLEALYPLESAGKLGVFVFQFPPWLIYKPENLDFILARRDLLGRRRMAVEFRHGSWYAADVREKVFHFLRKNQIIHVVADEPQYGSLATVPFVPQTTADIAYYRLHGRNRENWLRKGIETSFTDEELKEFIPHVQTSEKMAKETFVMFNNCHGGYAMRNAEKMKALLKI